jgi:uncharacterized membrane protein YhaH (DUF805 family)
LIVGHPDLHGEHRHLSAAGRGLSQAFWALAAGVIVAYVFFLGLGAFGSGEVLALTIAVAILAALWLLHALHAARQRDRDRDPGLTRARERRGF